ncbi:MAG TPA: acyl-ACP--UDP-N- acetylglucosamine O-acyltransferase [Gammaproteobacteria bacterium]|nr:acyl-ACP--UDP-N- acetylglucosamine O-acyltransferase [Gammaproteobacteria bacterium]
MHITETLGEQQREDLVAALEDSGGITAAEFCPLRYHLMLVRYDRELYSSQDVLNRVTSQNVNAKLIGPV